MDISIIIPTLNRSGVLAATLESIVAQRSPEADFEVIVIDNGSVDDTKAVCSKMSAVLPNLVYIYDDVPGQLTGRHKGFQESRGDLLCYLDDDVILYPSWLKSLRDLSRRFPEMAIFGGPSLPLYEVEPPEWISRFWETTPYGGRMCLPLSLIDLERETIIVDPLYIFGLNFSIRKNTLRDLGGFHPDCIPAHLQRYQGDGETGLAIKAGMKDVKAMHSRSLALHHQVPAHRLTAEYFGNWSFYNGVCQSFTDLRYINKLYTGKSAKQNSRLGVIQTIARFTAKISQKLKKTGRREVPDSIHQMYQQGYNFHQEAFRTDTTVRAWVLKTDYFDYCLPI